MTGAIYDDSGIISNHSITISTLWNNLKNLQNRSINMSVGKDFKVKGKMQIAKKRAELNKISGEFEIKYCLAILNSKFAKWFFNQVRRSAIGLYPDDIKKLPIKISDKILQNFFESIVEQIIENKKQNEDTTNLENQIDLMVYKLYELTYEVVKIVDENIAEVLAEFGLSKADYERMSVKELAEL